ncbi:MAG: cbb3-type cytochrome oxidase assembly protein CcoS [Desulfobacterales bacterium]
MYFPYFATYMALGIALAIAAFVWALKNGQFADQQRARFLPLEDEAETWELKRSRMGRLEILAVGFLACAGLAASAAVLFFALVSF